jgi:hypothetical protein
MFQPKQLLISTLIVLLLSCNSTYKQDEQTNLPGLTKDSVVAVPKRDEIKPDTAAVVERTPAAFKVTKTQKAVIAISNVQVQTPLENDFKTIERGFHDFVINNNFDTILLCKEGTVFKIKHSSFLIASNLTEAKGAIKFQVKEFYKISDILAARLATHSNGNILETAGMLYIQATSGGQLCKLKDNSAIEVSFPFTEKKENMRLFSGSWTNQKINWEIFPLSESIKSTYPKEEQNTNNTAFKNDFEAKMNDTNINRVKAAEIGLYIFSTSKLGWINCDRFYNSPNTRIDFYVDCGDYTEIDIKIVFHSFKGILDNFAYKPISKFKNIPDNEAITVVVIKKINNENLISLTESNTNLGSINNLAFEKVTMDELKQKLEQLNNVR